MTLLLNRSLCLAVILMGSSASAQPGIDTLRNIARNDALHDTVRIAALQEGAEPWFQLGQPDSALAWVRAAYHLARQHGDAYWTVRSMYLVGTILGRSGNVDSAEVWLDRGLAYRPEPARKKIIGTLWVNKSMVHIMRDSYSDAAVCVRKGLDIYEQLNDSAGIAHACTNLGGLFVDAGDEPGAAPYFERALSIFRARNDPRARNALVGLAKVAWDQGDTATAMANYREALAISNSIGDKETEALVYLNMAEGALEYHHVEDAERWLTRSRAITTNPVLEMRTLIQEARLALLHHDHATVIQRSTRLIAEAIPMRSLSHVSEGYHMRAQALQALGRSREAYADLELFTVYTDSVINEDRVRALTRSDMQYALDKAQRTDSLEHAAALNAEQQRNAVSMAGERLRRTSWAIAAFALLAISALLFARYRSSRRNSIQLAEKNRTILEAQKKLIASERLLEASELRTRIARDVHDQLGSDLTKITLLSSEAVALSTSHPTELPAIANDIERIAGEANRSLGDIVWAIDPHHDSLAGLTERVRAHCERMLKWSKVEHTVDCMHTGPDRTLDPATKRDIYLMLREALNNAIKYAKATHIGVKFRSSGTHVAFEVTDDGVGIPTENNNGHGLKNMQARAARIGGHLDLESRPGAGARISFRTELTAV